MAYTGSTIITPLDRRPESIESADRLNRENAINRLQQIRRQWEQFPGRAPGGTGLTGLTANDSKGWSNVLNEQTEAKILENELAGKAGPTIKYGGELGGMPANLAEDPAWYRQFYAHAAPMGPTMRGLKLMSGGKVVLGPDGNITSLEALKKAAK